MIGCLFLAAIELSGVTGTTLRSRAFFDAHNVKVGDPLVLTVDFIGEADFSALHPPALSKAVGKGSWKVDDASAKTDTYRDARRLTYRVRPVREGVVYFPSLEFSYIGPDGSRRTLRTNEIPVHAKKGKDVVVEGMDEDFDAMPSPADLIVKIGEKPWGTSEKSLTEDELFAWRKSCANPTADAFAAFRFPEARLNEARCALVEGKWARAMKIYRALEWRTGQSEEIEKGIVAALAMRYGNPAATLPVWRQVLRPVLRFAWAGRLTIILSLLALVAFLFWLFGRIVRVFAALAFSVALLSPADVLADDIFERMNEQMRRMRQRMNAMPFGGFTGIAEDEQSVINIKATAAKSVDKPVVGEEFEYVLSIETLSSVTLSSVRITPSETVGLKVTGQVRNLPDLKSGPSNVVKRLAIPVRYDMPLKTEVSFVVSGMAEGRATHLQRRMTFSYSRSFRAASRSIPLEVKPLPGDSQPSDFQGLVSESLRIHEMCDILKVETNDVVCITYRMHSRGGFVPASFLPPSAAFEMTRDVANGVYDYRRFFVADGAGRTPEISVSYYDPRTKTYKRAKTGGTRLIYVP